MAALNIFQRPATFLLEAFGDQLWGFKPGWIAVCVRHKGAFGALFWFARMMPGYERILETWGPIRTHLLTTAISVLNGCWYCTQGHAYALQLHYLRQTDRLFPLTEREMFQLHELSEDAALAEFEQGLDRAGLGGEIFVLRRMVELKRNRRLAVSRGDRDLLHLLDMFGTLNLCSPASPPKTKQAHDPINKNRAIHNRYAALRSSQTVSERFGEASLRENRHWTDSDITVLHPGDLLEN